MLFSYGYLVLTVMFGEITNNYMPYTCYHKTNSSIFIKQCVTYFVCNLILPIHPRARMKGPMGPEILVKYNSLVVVFWVLDSSDIV